MSAALEARTGTPNRPPERPGGAADGILTAVFPPSRASTEEASMPNIPIHRDPELR